MITFGLGGMTPQGAFKRKHPDPIFQINLGYLRQIKAEKPLFGGMELGYGIMDQYSADIDFVVDGVTETWDVTSTSQFLVGKVRFFIKVWHWTGLQLSGY
ncbi:MAG: hypothetical protein IPK46_07040 [Saprospiraceae bacterium]|nr:hypothetical protein [Saprospiraceae bacterium]